eukprot:762047-Pelagomonas_calceolata.AAC.3
MCHSSAGRMPHSGCDLPVDARGGKEHHTCHCFHQCHHLSSLCAGGVEDHNTVQFWAQQLPHVSTWDKV